MGFGKPDSLSQVLRNPMTRRRRVLFSASCRQHCTLDSPLASLFNAFMIVSHNVESVAASPSRKGAHFEVRSSPQVGFSVIHFGLCGNAISPLNFFSGFRPSRRPDPALPSASESLEHAGWSPLSEQSSSSVMYAGGNYGSSSSRRTVTPSGPVFPTNDFALAILFSSLSSLSFSLTLSRSPYSSVPPVRNLPFPLP